jgi:hypothetical protein
MTERDSDQRSAEQLRQEGGDRPGAEIGLGRGTTFEPEEDTEQDPETDTPGPDRGSTPMDGAGGALMG